MNSTITDIQEFAQRNSSAIALGVSVLLLVAVVAIIGLNTYDKRTTKKIDYAPQNTKPVSQNTQDRGIRSEIVTRANLFGSAAPKVIVAAPKTTLNLTLKGILSADSPKYARAIIQSDTKPSQLYSIGDEIKGSGAKLEAIRPHEVLLNRSGAIESLPLDKLGSSRGASINYSSAPKTADLNPGSSTLATLSRENRLNQNDEGSARNDQRRATGDAPNGPRRKIKRPSFSGIDRAIKKAEEI